MIDLNRLILIYFPRIALVLFILLISIAMIIYPGGTYRDLSTEGYIFSQNFLLVTFPVVLLIDSV